MALFDNASQSTPVTTGSRRKRRKGPALPAEQPNPINPYGDMLGTGPEGLAFNNAANAIQGGLGLLGRGGAGQSQTFGGQNLFMKNLMTDEYGNFENIRIANPSNDSYRWIDHLRSRYAPRPEGWNQTGVPTNPTSFDTRRAWRRAKPPKLPVGATPPAGQMTRDEWRALRPGAPSQAVTPVLTPEQIANVQARDQEMIQAMVADARNRWARSSPTARGYFSEGWIGPGRTITG